MMSPDLLDQKSEKINRMPGSTINSRANRNLHGIIFRLNVQTSIFECLDNCHSGMESFHTLMSQVSVR
jgi:hypothetical protein